MSYILEALKKAQAERQIGSTPTIHAPTLAGAPARQGARSNRTPVIVAMALMAAAIAGLATMLVRQQPAGGQPPAAIAPAAATPAAAATANASTTPAPPAAESAAGALAAPTAPAAAAVRTVPEAPDAALAAASVAPPTAAAATPTTRAADARAVQAAVSEPAAGQRNADARAAQQATTPAVVRAPEPALPAATPAPPALPAPVEEQVQSLRELPEPIQRAIPQITLGGYMYSKNPADRLLLIDKVLRKEGEEVAPGLILDKLQPKQAIFSFRGYRYRVPL